MQREKKLQYVVRQRVYALNDEKKTEASKKGELYLRVYSFEAYSIHTGSLLRFFTAQWSSATTDESKGDIDIIGKAKERHARSMQ